MTWQSYATQEVIKISIRNIGRNKWRVVIAKAGVDRRITGSKQDAIDFEQTHSVSGSKASSMTFKAFCENKWLPNKNIAKTTMRNYKQGLAYLSALHSIPLKDLTPLMIEETIQSLPTPSIRANAKSTASAALRTAYRLRLIPYNIMDSVEVEGLSNDRALPEAYTLAEADEILELFMGDYLEPVVILMLNCGLRKEEALALDFEDITSNGEIEICKAYTAAGHEVDEKGVKTEECFTAYIAGPSLARLIELCDGRTGAICTVNNKRIHPTTAYRHFQKIIARANEKRAIDAKQNNAIPRLIRYIPISNLRHSAATIALGNGVDVALVSKMLNHKRLSTTVDRYIRPLKEARKEAAQVMGGLFGNTSTLVSSKKVPKTMEQTGLNPNKTLAS